MVHAKPFCIYLLRKINTIRSVFSRGLVFCETLSLIYSNAVFSAFVLKYKKKAPSHEERCYKKKRNAPVNQCVLYKMMK